MRARPMETLPVALVQMRSGIDPDANLDAAEVAIRRAADEGARCVLTPECTNLVQKDSTAAMAVLKAESEDPALPRLSALAGELGVHLVIGSLALKGETGKAVNRTVVFGPDGALQARYDKVHMFDVGLGQGETYRESDTYAPGQQPVIADIVDARLGLSICYDVRFGYLYRALAQAGAQILTVPAAFTRPTGRAHWEVLLRARAIETGSYVLAPAQGGLHEDGRRTWGHSMIIGPWGEIVAELKHDEPGILHAVLDMRKVSDARQRIPALSHDRAVSAPVQGLVSMEDQMPADPATEYESE